MYRFKSPDNLNSFIDVYKEFKQLVCCQICFGIPSNAVKIACSHTFCEKCLQTFESFVAENDKSKQSLCPVCRKPFSEKQNLVIAESEVISKFFNVVENKLLKLTLTKITDGTLQSNVENLLGKTTIEKPNELSTELVQPKITPKRTRGRPRKSSDTPKGKSNIKQKAKDTPTSRRAIHRSTAMKIDKSSPQPSTSKHKDAFDLLMETAIKNDNFKSSKPVIKRTYSNRKKIKTPPLEETKIFQDEDTRIGILKWLSNNQNQFDRLTQTQEIYTESQKSFYMNSVSQLNRQFIIEKDKDDEADIFKNVPRRRTKSLDIKDCNESHQLKKSYSIAGMENMAVYNEKVILPFKYQNEAKAIIDQIEEEYLDNIDEILLNIDKMYTTDQTCNENKENNCSINEQVTKKDKITESKQIKTFEVNKAKEKMDSKKKDVQIDKNCSKISNTSSSDIVDNSKTSPSGWERLEKTQKSLGEKKKKPIKITKTVVQSDKESNPVKPQRNILETKKQNRLSCTKAKQVKVIKNDSSTSMVGDLKLSTEQNKSAEDPDDFFETKTVNTIVEINKDQIEKRTNDKSSCYNISEVTTTQQENPINISEITSNQSYVKSLETTPSNKRVKKIIEFSQIIVLPEKTLLSKPSIDITEEKQNDQVFEANNKINNLESNHDLLSKSEDYIFFEPTQRTGSNQSRNESNYDKFLNFCFEKLKDIKHLKTCNDSLILSNHNDPLNCVKNNETIIQNIDNIKEYLDDLKNLVSSEFKQEHIYKGDVSDMEIDVELTNTKSNIGKLNVSGMKTQTNNSDRTKTISTTSSQKRDKLAFLLEKAIQTESEEKHGFNISSNEAFKTLDLKTVCIQTDNLYCPKCENNITDFNCNNDQNALLKNSENLVDSPLISSEFSDKNVTLKAGMHRQVSNTSSRDSPSFLREDHLTHRKSKLSRPSKENKIDTQQSELVITLPSPKKPSAFRRLTYTEIEDKKKKFKRIRSPESESDSEEPPTKKILSDSFSLEGSDNFNYDRCLENILKKYDNETSSKKSRETPERNKSLEIVAKCDEMINNISKLDSIDNRSLKRKAEDILESPKKSNQEMEKTPKSDPFSASLFSNVDNFEEFCRDKIDKQNIISGKKVDTEEEINGQNDIDQVLEQYDKEMYTLDLDDVEICNITSSIEKYVEKPHYENDYTECNRPDVESSSNKSADMFESDADEDIVETTPQKDRSSFSQRGLLSQVFTQSKNSMLLPPPKDSPDIVYTESFIGDITLAPPVGFGDEDEETTSTLNNSLNLEKMQNPREASIVSEKDQFLSPYIKIDRSSAFVRTSTQNQDNSVVANFPKDIDISPIHKSKPYNPIEIMQNTKFSPLTVITSKPSNQNLNVSSSTPKQKTLLSFIRPTQGSSSSSKSSLSNINVTVINKKPCIACSRLEKNQVMAITTMTNKKLATYSSVFNSSVTHMVVTTNEDKCLKDHTIKYVSAVAAGIWVIDFTWVQECLNQNKIVSEEPYEVLDVSGSAGPKQSRLLRMKEPLFKGYKIYAAPPFLSTTQKDVENVVTLLGGHTVQRPDDLMEKDGYVRLIVTEASATQDFALYETWLDTLNIVTVDIEWLSRSVGQYKVLSVRPYALCSDDTLTQLGYPEDLISNVSFTQGVTAT